MSMLREATLGLIRAPRFSLTVILTLALAIGCVGTLGNLLYAVALRPLSVSEPEQLAVFYPGRGEGLMGIDPNALAEINRQQTVFEELCGITRGAVSMEINGATGRRVWEGVNGSCADVLRLQPTLGRLIGREDILTPEQSARVAVLSYRFWKQSLGGDPSVLGSTIVAQNVPLTVIGIGPAGYDGLTTDIGPDVTIPLSLYSELMGSRPLALWALGRLRPGETIDSATAAMKVVWPLAYAATVTQTSAQQLSRVGSPDVVHVESAAMGLSELRTRYERALYALTGFGALLWALACVNVSGVFLIRTIARETELKIHAALGASRARLVGRITGEAALLIAIVGLLAFGAMNTVGAYLIRAAWTSVSPSTVVVAPDRLAMFTLLALCAITVFVVVAPSLIVVLMRDWVSLVASARDTPRRATAWWRRAIVTAQVAASLVLVAVAIVLAQNLWQLRALPTGVAQNEIAFARLEPKPGLRPLTDASDVLRDMLDRAANLPGSDGSAFAVSFPTSELRQVQATAPGYRAERALAGSEVAAAVDWISPGFFHTVGMRLIAGRDLSWDDGPGHPEVAVISARMAQRVFAAMDPIGQRVRIPSGKLLTVVGVVSDAAGGDPRVEDFPRMYLPVLQDPRRIDAANLIVRHSGALDVRAGMQAVVNAIGRQSVLYVRTVNEQTSLVLGRERLLAQVSSYFAVLAVLVVVVGLYGVLAYAVAQRRRELAIRAALGAQRLKLLTTVVGETAWMTIAGIAVGVPAALWARRAVEGLLFNGPDQSAMLLASAIGIMAVAMIVATLAPSRQLLRTAVIEALRQD